MSVKQAFRPRHRLGRAVPLLVLLIILLASFHAAASFYCEDIEGNWLFVGEAMYFDDSTAYANAFWRGSNDELDLGGYAGGADGNATDLRFFMYGWGSEQDPNECDQGTFTLELLSSTSGSGGCPSGTPESFSTGYSANSCGSTAFIWMGKGFGRTGLDYVRYWQATVSVVSGVDAGDAVDSDEGCFEVLSDSVCILENF